jgi:hypothetical protein
VTRWGGVKKREIEIEGDRGGERGREGEERRREREGEE